MYLPAANSKLQTDDWASWLSAVLLSDSLGLVANSPRHVQLENEPAGTNEKRDSRDTRRWSVAIAIAKRHTSLLVKEL